MHESHPSNVSLRIAAALGAVYVIWGSTYLAIRIGIESIPPFLMAGVRFVVAGGALYAWVRWRGAAKPDRIHWRSATIIGAWMLLGGNGGVCWAEQHVPSGLTALIIGTTPVWMTLLDWLWHGAGRPSARVALGLILGFAGVGLLISPGEFAGGDHVDPAGAGVLILATMSWAAGSLYSRRAALPATPLLGTAMEMLAGGIVLLAVSAAVGEWGRCDAAAVSARSLTALGYLIVFGSLIAFSAYIWLFRVTSTALASTYAYVNPLIAVFLGWAIVGEPITPRTLLAAVAIIAAVVAVISRPRRASA
jgi:drug/metabolite transporter (DMT)-like permease